MAWLAFAWSRPAFPADALAPASTTQSSDDASADSQPVDAVTFLDAGVTAPVADAPADKPASSLRLAPIAIGWGGSVGYDIEQRSSRGGNARLRQRIMLKLNGQASSYILQPWIAQVRSNLGFIASKNKSDDTGSSSNMISGSAGLYLVPYSRYPFEAVISRNQNYSGPGLGSPVSQTTRFDMKQRYTPRHRKETYQVGYNRSQSDSGGLETARQNGLHFNMASGRFKQQTIEVEAMRQRDTRPSSGQYSLLNRAAVRHGYLPNAELSLDSNASLLSSSDQAVLVSNSSRIRELNSTLSLQPLKAPYSVIGTARVYVSDRSSLAASSQTSQIRIANANLGANYRLSQYFILSASGNVNVTNGVRSQSLGSSQSAIASYPMEAIDLDVWRYTPRLSGTINNSTNNSTSNGISRTDSVQTASMFLGHSLNRGLGLNGGKLALGLNQSLSLSESTRSQATARLSHSGSANWHRVQGKTNTSLRLGGRDSRSLSRTQDSFQSIELNANISEEFSRDSKLSGNLTVQTTRQVYMTEPSANILTTSSFTLQYSHQRAFKVPRLIFSSSVRAYSKSLIPVLVATPEDQGPVTWENELSYTVGRLAASFKVNLSKGSDDTTQSLIALSLKRYF